MALKRKRLKEHGEFTKRAFTCSFCKEKKAFHYLTGGFVPYTSWNCCDDCYVGVRKEEEKLVKDYQDYEMTEADYQTWGRL